jgi:periplasmic protein TonB
MESYRNYISLSNKAPVFKIIVHLPLTNGIKTYKMKTELIMKSDVLDIIFENRNKAYGAYTLRKFYDNRLLKSIAVMMGVVVVLSAFTFIPKKGPSDKLAYDVIDNELATIKPDVKPVEPVKPDPPKVDQAPTQKFINVIKIVPNDVMADSLPDNLDKKMIGSVTNNLPGDGPLVVPPSNPVGTGSGEPEPVKAVVDVNVPTDHPDVMPSFPGGMEGLKKFLQRNLNNPKEMEEGEMVSVKTKFVVGYDGKLKSFEIIQDGGEEFNKEVIRVLKKMPEWVPGKSNGQNVSVYYTIPVKFVPAN